jgi:hypothetical protein
MTIFDLVFLLIFFGAAAALVTGVGAVLRGHGPRAAKIAGRTMVVTAAYFALVVAVAVASPQRLVALGQPQCSDDWCITPDSVHGAVRENAMTYTVSFQLSSRARRVAQRERFVVAYLRTREGRRIDPVGDKTDVPFDTLLQPGQTVRASRRFVVAHATDGLGLVVAREGGFRFPGCCIVGDESSFLHKHTIISVDSSTGR